MSQINLRLSKEDYYLLELIAKKDKIPITSLFRTIINPAFNEWKIKLVFDLYASGNLGFKQILKYSGFSINEFLEYIEKNNIEPIFSELAEQNSTIIADILQRKDLFTNPNYRRKSPPKVKKMKARK